MGVMATALGPLPTLIGVPGMLVAILIGVTVVPELELGTYAVGRTT